MQIKRIFIRFSVLLWILAFSTSFCTKATASPSNEAAVQQGEANTAPAGNRVDEPGSSRFDEVNHLIEQRKYLSAFSLLSEMNDDFNDPEVLARQFRFIPKYFIQSMMHQLFIFKDLEGDETIMALREFIPDGDYQYTMFDPVEAYELYMEHNPRNYELDVALGEYYLDAASRYGDEWIMPAEEARQKAMELFKNAEQHGAASVESLSEIALDYLQLNDFQHAAEYYERAMLLFRQEFPNGEDPNLQYNYAIAMFSLGNIDEGLAHMEYAMEHYNDNQYRADAFMMGTQAAFNIGDFERGEHYLLQGFELFPQDYRFAQNLNALYLFQDDLDEAGHYADFLFSLDPYNPTACRMVMENYQQYEKTSGLESFFLRNMATFNNDNHAKANLSFHYATVLIWEERTEEALSALEDAQRWFSESLPADHDVFGVIEQTRAELE